MVDSTIQLLENSELFGSLDRADLSRVAQSMRAQTVDANQLIFAKGDSHAEDLVEIIRRPVDE